MDANPTLDQLTVFLTVAEEGGFSAAARKLNRAQSVISYGIANLEAQLEVALFDRAGTRKPVLTDAGRVLLEDARRMAADLQMLRARAQGLKQGLEAEVRLGVDALLPMPVLTAVLTAFRGAFPTVGIRLLSGVLGAVPAMVASGEADVGIATESALDDARLDSRLIGRKQLVPVAAPGHPLALATPTVPAAIVRDHFQIVIADPSERTRGTDFHVYAFNTWRVADAETKRALIRAGLGWGGLPGWMVDDDVADGRLVELHLDPYPRTEYLLLALRAAGASWGPAATWLVDRFERELAAFP